MSEPTNPPAFDPRRLADLASRLGAQPAPAVPQSVAPQPDGAGEAAGHVQIDAVLAELKRAEQLPPDQQIAVYEAVHRTLQETLRSIEQS